MRFFWKIFGGYWLAWALLSLATFGGLVLLQHAEWWWRPGLSQTQPSQGIVQYIATNLSFGGEPLLRRVAEAWPRGEPPLVVDDAGRDLLGRAVDPATLEVARAHAVERDEPAPARWAHAPDGRRFVVYFPLGGGPADRLLVRWFLEWPWLVGVVLALGGLLLAGGLTAAWTRPITLLKRACDLLAAGDFKARVDPRLTARRDEIGELGRHFDAMASRLAHSNDLQRQLLHDVSHELRSPLARLGVATELARRRPERAAEALDRIDTEAQRLDRLIGEVLALARAEADGDTTLEDYVDLLELLRTIRDDLAFEAEAIGVEVELTLPPTDEMVLRGDAELLHRAVENVVRNALQHAGDARRIELELVDRWPHPLQIRVRDDGDAVPADELETFFEPFHRGQGSRGFGLGLAIARRAVEVHDGSIEARLHPDGGLEVVLELPREALV
ncbi:MAG: ATP-binding protein [Acidobacteriota bacterium]